MHSSGFDALAKFVAGRRLSRRQALRAGGLGLAATTIARVSTAAAQSTPAAGSAPSEMADNNATLFVQTATDGTFAANPASGSGTPGAAGTPTAAQHGAYLLTLHGHTGETIAFSDRPQRNFGEVKTPQFFKSMGFTPDNPPNAALVVDSPQQEGDVLLVELLNPAYDDKNNTLTYEANILTGYKGEVLKPLASKQQDQHIAAQFESASLFIDDCADNFVNCYDACNHNIIGTLGMQGFCWSWSDFECEPCNGSWGGTADQCNQQFSACGGACFSNYAYYCGP